MHREQQLARILFALGMIGLGVLALVYGARGLTWYSIPAWLPWRAGVAYGSGIVLLLCGSGLLSDRTVRMSACILVPYLVIWLLLRVPTLATAPLTEVNWQNAGELAVILSGGLVLFAQRAAPGASSRLRFATGDKGIRVAVILFALALPAFGLSHFVYVSQTTPLVPAWLPFRSGWAYLTGVAHIAAGIGVLFSILPRLAATMEAAMLSVFTLLVWVPAIVAAPASVGQWTEFLISWAITAGAWVVAASIASDDSVASRHTQSWRS